MASLQPVHEFSAQKGKGKQYSWGVNFAGKHSSKEEMDYQLLPVQRLAFQMALPLPHPSALLQGGRPKEPVQRCMYKTFLIPFSCHTNTVLIIVLPLTSCSSFISILCPIESSSYPIGRGLVNQMRKFLSFHNLPLAETLLNALTQNQGGLFQELIWSYLLLNLEMMLCIILISGATITSAKCQSSTACCWLWDTGTTYRQ